MNYKKWIINPISDNVAKLMNIHQHLIIMRAKHICVATLRDLKSETSKGSKTRLYQIVHTTDSVSLVVNSQ